MANSGVKESEAMELNEAPTPIVQQQQQQQKKKWKTCLECGTSKTPLWRSGPAGPKSLCNACGIRSRKKKPDDLGPNKNDHEKGKKRMRINDDDGSSSSGESLEQTLTRLVREVMTEMPLAERTWNMLGEEEQAALMLMSLSASDRF